MSALRLELRFVAATAKAQSVVTMEVAMTWGWSSLFWLPSATESCWFLSKGLFESI